MAKRRKNSPTEDFMNLVARLPWWAGCALAVVAYWWLSHIAAQPIGASVAPGQVRAVVTQSIWKAMAGVGQYLVPFLCLAGAGISAFKRIQRRNLFAGVAQSAGADALNGMSWQDFELLVGEAFRLQGYQVGEVGGGGADGGIDLVLHKGSEKFLVQCKQWKAQTVGVTIMRELYGVMAATGAAGGFVVTSGRFTQEAESFASGRNLHLIDGGKLFAWIKKAKSVAANSPINQRPVTPVPPAQIGPPSCPTCSKPMVQRTAKRGNAVGSAFWGCSSYPACRGTRSPS